MELPAGPFDVIVADPPWRFASNSAARPGRNAMRHYPCMRVEEIAALPVQRISAPDALLLLWVTVPFMPRVGEVLAAWGFRYCSQLVWVKEDTGLGYWARNRHELVIIARRGRFPCLVPALFPDSVIVGGQREHSRKPEYLHRVIDARLPATRRLEMFARSERRGWTSWGNETQRFGEAV